MLGAVIIFIVILSLAVFVHECGHFFSARKFGIGVEEFGFGFPPRLFGIKRGDMIYSINLIPIGGFVRMKGEAGENNDPDSFGSQSVSKRIVVIVAGVMMNLMLAWVLFSFGSLFGLPEVIGNGSNLSAGAMIADRKVHVVNVLEESPADSSGLEMGDVVLSVNGQKLSSSEELSSFTETVGSSLELEIDRSGETVFVTSEPVILEETGQSGIGVQLVETGLVSYPLYLAPLQGLKVTAEYVYDITAVFFGILRDLVTVGQPSVTVSGPIGIAVMTGDVARYGFLYLVQFAALLSVNLAVLNILPLPALDGGRLVFLLIEAVRGKAVSSKWEGLVHNLGFALLMVLVVVISYGDVVRFGDRIIESVSQGLL